MKVRKALVGGVSAAALALGGLALGAAPAQAAVVQNAGCVDGGGIEYDASIKWNYRYEATGDVIRASVSDLVITRSDAEVKADDSAFDVGIKVYNGSPSGSTLIQNRFFDAYDPAVGGAGTPAPAGTHYAKFNPANPISNGDRVGVADSYSYVVVTIGTDSDGFGDCKITFKQPDGLPFNPSA
jgi:hypothetical protein